jgi:hypothetical protein
MDVFGAIVNALHLTGQIIDYLQAVKDADDERSRLLSEITTLSALLPLLRDRVKDARQGGGFGISAAVVETGVQGSLKECNSTLEYLANKLKPSQGLKGVVRTLKWPFARGGIRDELEKIEKLKSLISLVFQTSMMWVIILSVQSL